MVVGEEPEGNWGIVDDYTKISKQQSPGHREDFTTDVFTARNVRRVHQMGQYSLVDVEVLTVLVLDNLV